MLYTSLYDEKCILASTGTDQESPSSGLAQFSVQHSKSLPTSLSSGEPAYLTTLL